MVIYPESDNFPQLNFVFALIYCVANTTFAVFVLVASILLTNKTKRPNKISNSPSTSKMNERRIQPERIRVTNNSKISHNRMTPSRMTPVYE